MAQSTITTTQAQGGNGEEKTVRKDGYELTFYPGFASRCVVRNREGEEVEVFRQEETYHLPKGQTKPKDRHLLRLKGGKHQQDVTFEITDPGLRVARITVELYGENHQLGVEGDEDDVDDTVVVENHPKLCPPNC